MSFKETREKLLVLDKNALRAVPAANAKIQADSTGLGVLVIDTTFKEIARAGNWPKHYENDFRDWTDRPDRMSISWGVGELLRDEKQTGKAASIVDAPMTKRHRELLTLLGVGDQAAIQKAGPEVQKEAARMLGTGGELNAQERLAMMRSLVDIWWKHGNKKIRQDVADELNDPAAGPLKRLGQLVITDKGMRDMLQTSLIQSGYLPDIATALLHEATFTNFLHAGFEAYSLILWAQGQKLDSTVNVEKFLNQMIDLDYVAYGLCCSGLVTNEHIIRRLETGLRIACESQWT